MRKRTPQELERSKIKTEPRAKLTAMNEYRQARRREKHIFKKKKGQLDDQTLFKIEGHHSVQDSCKFYKRLNDTETNDQLLTSKDQVLSRWKKCFKQHLNESFEEEPHVINLPSREKIVEALK
jgi:hypothetical protein